MEIQQPVNNLLGMLHKANFDPTWEVGIPSSSQALPSNIQKSYSQAQLPTKKPKKQPKPKTKTKTQTKN
jgi:hypothetical protein